MLTPDQARDLNPPVTEQEFIAPNPAYTGFAGNLFWLAVGLTLWLFIPAVYGSRLSERTDTFGLIALAFVGLVFCLVAIWRINASSKNAPIKFDRPLSASELLTKLDGYRKRISDLLPSIPSPPDLELSVDRGGKRHNLPCGHRF